MENYSQNPRERTSGTESDRDKSAQPRAFSRGITMLIKAGVILVVLVLAIFILAWIFGRSFSIPKPPEHLGTKTIDTETSTAINLDTDNDNLKDWEETIYHTDPKNADTDGDGTGDEKEISTNRNPLKAGPDDKTESETKENDTISDSYSILRNLSSQGNLTQAMVYQVISKNGIDSFLKPDQTDSAIAELQGYLQKMRPTTTFSENDFPDSSLTISSDVSKEAMKAYFNTVGTVYEKNFSTLAESDVTIALTAIQTNDASKMKQIARTSEAVKKTLDDIKNMPVPRSLLLFHKKELYFLKHTSEELNLLESASINDALYVALIISMRIATTKEATQFHRNEIPLWLEQNGVVFMPHEKALLLYQHR